MSRILLLILGSRRERILVAFSNKLARIVPPPGKSRENTPLTHPPRRLQLHLQLQEQLQLHLQWQLHVLRPQIALPRTRSTPCSPFLRQSPLILGRVWWLTSFVWMIQTARLVIWPMTIVLVIILVGMPLRTTQLHCPCSLVTKALNSLFSKSLVGPGGIGLVRTTLSPLYNLPRWTTLLIPLTWLDRQPAIFPLDIRIRESSAFPWTLRLIKMIPPRARVKSTVRPTEMNAPLVFGPNEANTIIRTPPLPICTKLTPACMTWNVLEIELWLPLRIIILSPLPPLCTGTLFRNGMESIFLILPCECIPALSIVNSYKIFVGTVYFSMTEVNRTTTDPGVIGVPSFVVGLTTWVPSLATCRASLPLLCPPNRQRHSLLPTPR